MRPYISLSDLAPNERPISSGFKNSNFEFSVRWQESPSSVFCQLVKSPALPVPLVAIGFCIVTRLPA
jgi:hypothetical protein